MAVNYTESEFLSQEARDYFAAKFKRDGDWYAPEWQERYEKILYENGAGLNPPMNEPEKELIRARRLHLAAYWKKPDTTHVQ